MSHIDAPMPCPGCKYTSTVMGDECPRCGLIFSKWSLKKKSLEDSSSKPLLSSKKIQTFPIPIRWIAWPLFLAAAFYLGTHIKAKPLVYQLGMAAHGGAPTNLIDFENFIRDADFDAVNLYLKSGTSPNVILSGGTPAYIKALIPTQKQEVIQAFLNAGPDMKLTDGQMNNALHRTMDWYVNNDLQKWLVQELISRGVDVNAKNNRGETPLILGMARMIFANGGPSENQKWLIQYLVDHGADVYATDSVGRMAGDIHVATSDDPTAKNPFGLPESPPKT